MDLEDASSIVLLNRLSLMGRWEGGEGVTRRVMQNWCV